MSTNDDEVYEDEEEDSGPPPTCSRCGGEMEGGELLSQGADRNWVHRTDGSAAAVSPLVAWVCVECGWVDFYVADIDRFLQD